MRSESYVEIGGMTVRLTGEKGLEQTAGSGAFRPFLTESRQCDANISLDTELPMTPFHTLHEFDFQTIAKCRFGRDGNSFHFVMHTPDGKSLRLRHNVGGDVEISRCPDRQMLHFALWMAFNLTGCTHGCLSIHSSCIVYRDGAILFLGESGTGKSTQSRLWHECHPETVLLNDDGPFLAPCNGRYEVYGSPWSGKTPCYRNLHYPIHAIVRVVQAPSNRVTTPSNLQKIGAILPSLPPALSRDHELQSHMLSMVSRLIGATPVLQLECLPDAGAVEALHEKLFPS
ncbi:MAG: hypothetical protein J6Y34_02645 [Bacteroidales bacterium]|nr:hypothetical protein [Bacteroidales bacterium]